MLRKKRLKRSAVITVVIAALCIAAAVAILITNFFIPVKYLTAYCVKQDKNARGVMRVSFIDVGYGDCTLIEFPDGKNLLIDGGDGTYSNNLKVLSALNSRGVDELDFIICSSVSKVRCGGLAEVVKYKSVGKVYAPRNSATYLNDAFRNFAVSVKNAGIPTQLCEYGAGVFNDEFGYNFCVLYPSVYIPDLEESEEDILRGLGNGSVIWVEYGGKGFLFTGDLTAEAQLKLFERSAFEVKGRTIDVANCSVLKIPNRGAEVSAADIYKKINPEYAVLSVGKNGTGCPSVSALALAQGSVGKNLYRTDADGTVVITVRDSVLSVKKEK